MPGALLSGTATRCVSAERACSAISTEMARATQARCASPVSAGSGEGRRAAASDMGAPLEERGGRIMQQARKVREKIGAFALIHARCVTIFPIWRIIHAHHPQTEYPAMPDRRDIAILDLLQQDALMPVAAIAEQVHLSPSACSRRIADLRRSGYITGSTTLLDRRKLGLPMTVFVIIRARHSADWLALPRGAGHHSRSAGMPPPDRAGRLCDETGPARHRALRPRLQETDRQGGDPRCLGAYLDGGDQGQPHPAAGLSGTGAGGGG
jgi:hypothetical protein